MGANAQTTVPTFTAGNVLTAAQMNQSARTGVPVFANTTDRDAAFGGTGEKTLAEGQLCYLEDSNIVQYYDGSSWLTLAPAPTATAATASVATSQTTTSGVYTDLATVGPSVTITTGTKALVIVGAKMFNAQAGGTTFMSYAVSGATTIAAGDSTSFNRQQSSGTNEYIRATASYLVTTLNAGSNVFTAKYATAAGTATYEARSLTVVPL